MRRITTQVGRSAASLAGREAITTLPSPPFVCASCRRAAIRPSYPSSITPKRTFATNSRKLQESSTAAASSTQKESFTPQTHYDFFPATFPDGPPPKSPFTPDLKQLRKEYLQLQAKAHPDLAPANLKRQAEATSMRINEAYKAIQDPLKRAQYLLSLRGIDVEDESAKLSENELLMEVMEVREAVEEVESEEELLPIRQENNARIDESVEVLNNAFARDAVDEAAEEAIRLRYWMNIEESIQGWEEGKGGGILHH